VRIGWEETKLLIIVQGSCTLFWVPFAITFKRWFPLLAGAAVLISSMHDVAAGNISFRLERTDTTLKLTNQGTEAAYFPGVLRLQSDGRWEPLSARSTTPAELAVNESCEFDWREPVHAAGDSDLANFTGLMVRFFDQSGASFGQIAMLNPPNVAQDISHVEYRSRRMTLSVNDVKNPSFSWLLSADESGIAPLDHPGDFTVHQTPARRIDWQRVGSAISVDMGPTKVAAILLHATDHGWVIQRISADPGSEQRAGWLNASEHFYRLAGTLAVAALASFAWIAVRRRGA
jgi:hypothetical protein